MIGINPCSLAIRLDTRNVLVVILLFATVVTEQVIVGVFD